MKRIFNLSFLFFVFSIPLSQYLSVRELVVLAIFSLALLYSKEALIQIVKQNWDLLLYVVVLFVGLLYSDDRTQAWRVLETNFCFVALPIVYGAYQKENTPRLATMVFSISVLVLVVISTAKASILYADTSKADVFLNYQLTEFVGLDPTYLAYYVIFVSTYIIFEMYYKTSDIPFLAFLIVIIFLFSILLLTGGKTAFVSLVLVVFFFALKYLLDIRSLSKTFTIVSVLLILGAFITISTSKYFSKILYNETDYWERSILWKSAMAANPSALFGVGTGDYRDVLNRYYETQGMTHYAEGSYNAHNQFIQLYFSNGILGLIALLVIIGRPLYLSFKAQNSLGILIMFPFIVYGMTEVFLGRYQGIVFFVLCHQIVTSQYYLMMPKLDLRTV